MHARECVYEEKKIYEAVYGNIMSNGKTEKQIFSTRCARIIESEKIFERCF